MDLLGKLEQDFTKMKTRNEELEDLLNVLQIKNGHYESLIRFFLNLRSDINSS